MTTSIVLIGGGQMSRALISGWTRANAPVAIEVVDPNPDARQWFADHFASVAVATDVAHVQQTPQVVVLAIKPQVAQSVLPAVATRFSSARPLYVSIMAGVSLTTLRTLLGPTARLARTMPNRPALLGLGVTGLAREGLTPEELALSESLLRAVGEVVVVDSEHDIDTVTAVSGSGPAYFFLLIECLEHAARELGLSAQAAHVLATQTALGAASMAATSSDDPATLRAQVTSKGGTTEAALAVLRAGGFESLIQQAVQAAQQRAAALALG